MLEGRGIQSQNHTDVSLTGKGASGSCRASEIQASLIEPEQDDMSGALRETRGDWLDACCWRCGTGEGLRDAGGPLLCPQCQAELSETTPHSSDDPRRVGLGAYWEAHAMERCWRCLTGSVDPEDEIGLCRACRTDLSAVNTSARRGPLGKRETPAIRPS